MIVGASGGGAPRGEEARRAHSDYEESPRERRCEAAGVLRRRQEESAGVVAGFDPLRRVGVQAPGGCTAHARGG
jgi:hypothetical protein